MASSKRLFLLDGMALIYRAHFAFIRNPIRTSKGVNTSALYGFATTLLDLVEKQSPTHLALVLDTDVPTFRHEEFPAYKAQRDEMPEDLATALPGVHRLAEAFRIPVITADGWEADDVIGTLAREAVREGGTDVFMVTADKDFGQLVDDHTRIWRPGRQGAEAEILGVAEVCAQWEIKDPRQVVDVLGLMGDASDNIPGVPGIGEKTAKKLIAAYGSVEEVLARTAELKGKQKETLEQHQAQALQCKRLATIRTDAPVALDWRALAVEEPDREAVAALFIEFEFNALGRRVLGADFKAGRGQPAVVPLPGMATDASGQGLLLPAPALRTLRETRTDYRRIDSAEAAVAAAAALRGRPRFCFDTETDSLDERHTRLLGISLSWEAGQGVFVVWPEETTACFAMVEALRPAFGDPGILKVGQNLKFDLAVLKAHGLDVCGPFFDTMLAHGLTHPDQRHTMDYMAESLLGYTPVPITSLIGDRGPGQRTLRDAFRGRPDEVVAYSCEDADITLQLAAKLGPELDLQGQRRVFDEIECPLVPVLVEMEAEGIRIDVDRLKASGRELQDQAAVLQDRVLAAAGVDFNLNSPKQLGEVLFEKMHLIEKPKKTRTGQYVTNEQVLGELAPRHPIVRDILDYREAVKLKSTYVDALQEHLDPRTGRVHTTFHQMATATGRLASSDPNLQNIPVRTELGRGIRDAFVARDDQHLLFSADYSQIELRVMAAISGDKAMRDDFAGGLDIHAATAARIHGIEPAAVTAEMRRRAKMVNFGIIYGISVFGLAQRLGVPRGEADSIIRAYQQRYPGVHEYMESVVAEGRRKGYVETLTGRRRYLRDLNSANQNIRSAAERMAINTPIQGTAADMIKLAMIRVRRALADAGLRSKLLLQVHDELVFDMVAEEEQALAGLVTDAMVHALPLDGVPVVVETGKGRTWLEAH